MSPVKKCPWFGSVNGDVVQLQGKFLWTLNRVLNSGELSYNVSASNNLTQMVN